MTTYQRILAAIIVVAVIILASFVSWKFGHKRGYSEGYSAPHPTDTVWRDTTIVKDSLIEVVKWKEKDKLVYVPVKVDSLIHDTTYVALPREFKMYADSTFEAQVSGVDPTLDWIKIHQKTAYITNYVEKSVPYVWSVSAFVDAGASSAYHAARVGLEYDGKIAGPLRGVMRGGYEVGKYGRDWFLSAGLKLDLIHK